MGQIDRIAELDMRAHPQAGRNGLNRFAAVFAEQDPDEYDQPQDPKTAEQTHR